MKKLSIFFASLFIFCFLTGCNKTEVPSSTDIPIVREEVIKEPNTETTDIKPEEPESQTIVEPIITEIPTKQEFINFNVSFFDTMLKDKEEVEKNFCISPFSLEQALLMVSTGTGEKTASQEELFKLLNKDINLSNGEISKKQKELYSNLQSNSSVDFTISNMVLLDDEFNKSTDIESNFVKPLEENYNALVEDADLQDQKIVEKVNNFVNEKTKGTIPVMIVEPFVPDTRVVLLNAIYFLGDWESPFAHDETWADTFYGINAENKIDMMHGEKYVSYFENEKVKSIALPYKSEEGKAKFEMVLVLPKEKEKSIIDVYNSLSLSEKEELLSANFDRKEDVSIVLPKFKVENTIELYEKTKEMGLNHTTEYGNKDFINIVDYTKEESLRISDIIQKTYIKVDEKGTEASAVTMVTMKNNSVAIEEESFDFIANKPFIYFIREVNTNTILFMGINTNLK